MAKDSSKAKIFQPPVEEQRESPISSLISKIQEMSEEEKRAIKAPENAIDYLTKTRDDPLVICKITRGYTYAQRINEDRKSKGKSPINSDEFVLGYIFQQNKQNN